MNIVCPALMIIYLFYILAYICIISVIPGIIVGLAVGLKTDQFGNNNL